MGNIRAGGGEAGLEKQGNSMTERGTAKRGGNRRREDSFNRKCRIT